MIQLIHVGKTFNTNQGDVHAVVDASLHVEKGDIYGVIGFSGAGKSTLIRCINLLERPTHGEVIIQNENILNYDAKQLRNARKKMGMIFQHFNLMASRNVAQNVAYPLKDSKLSKQEINDRVKELLNLVELSDKAKAYPSQLSGGQKQRVAIARALANRPDILLCDEATSALDPQTTQSILKLIKSLQEKLDLTVVIITHEMAVVKQICNKVAVMEKGKIVEAGEISSVFSNPQSEVTKNFINSTSSIHEVYNMIENNDPLLDCKANESIYRFNYIGGNAEVALISKISVDYRVDVNIIFGNVEILNGVPIGNLVVKIGGESKSVEAAVDYVKKQDVKVEVLKNA